MKLEGSYTLSAPRQEVWDVLMDPEAIAKTIPGCQKLYPKGDDIYEAQITIGIAAVKGAYTSKITIFDKNAPEGYKLKLQGKGARGFLTGAVAIRLEDQGAKTLLHYVAENQIGGPIAAVGQRLMGAAAKMFVNQGLKSLEKLIEERQNRS
jgi:carbon monoxide dehydrogenase subunit G